VAEAVATTLKTLEQTAVLVAVAQDLVPLAVLEQQIRASMERAAVVVVVVLGQRHQAATVEMVYFQALLALA
jgi:hypothetical protein